MRNSVKRILMLAGGFGLAFLVVFTTQLAKEKETVMSFPVPPSTKSLIHSENVSLKLGKIYSVRLNNKNTLVLRTPVSSFSIGKLQRELITKSASLSSNEPIYLVLDTPGGDVDAGNKFIDVANSIPQKITTITRFAASMGFHIAQNLGTRLVLPHGVLMSHHAHIEGFGGDVPGNGVTRLNALIRDLDLSDIQVANRMNISFQAYRELIKFEYWVTGPDAVRDHAADALVTASCDSSLEGEYTESVQTLFGDISVQFSNCPLISEPLAAKLSNNTSKLKDFYHAMFEEKEIFVHEYTTKVNIKKFIK